MPSCCHAEEYSSLFGGGEATVRSWLFRHTGLHGSARTAAQQAAAAGGPDTTLLEVGGGVGEIHVALVGGGRARSATNVELSTGWERRGMELLEARGLRDLVDRRIGDVVDEVDELPVADVVVAHRVLCCYPHWRRMVDAFALLVRNRLVLTLPVDRGRTRAFTSVGNRILARRGCFRTWVHPVDQVIARLAGHGLDVVDDDAGIVWRTIALDRRAPAAA